jgi:cysteine synthase A
MTIVDIDRKFRGLGHLIGNTPLLAIECRFRGTRRTVYAKAENLNMTGSIKDRMALHILRQGYARGLLTPGALIAEATSGNTGIAFCAVGRALGHPVTIFMPEWMSQERKDLIRSLGAQIRLVGREEGGFLGSIKMAEEFAAGTPGAFLPRQFSNEDNCSAHMETTGPEVWWQLRFHSLAPDAFVAGVGTGGTVMGVGSFLRRMKPNTMIFPLEPANSPTLSTGHKVGKHRIQGISDEFIPPILDLASLDEVVSVDDGDAILIALKVQERLGADAVVVTVFPDDNKKYLSTDLLRQEPTKEDFLAPHVRLDAFGAFKRVCHTCCDPLDCTQKERLPEVEEVLALPPCPRRPCSDG